MRLLIIVIAVVFTVNAQQILDASKNYKFTESMVVFTVKEFEKIEAAWTDDSLNVEKVKLLQQKVEIVESTNVELNNRIFLLDSKIVLQQGRLDLSVDRNILLNKKIIVYKDLFNDTDKELQKRRGKLGFFNNTFWFGFGTVVGVGIMYLSSEIVSNVD